MLLGLEQFRVPLRQDVAAPMFAEWNSKNRRWSEGRRCPRWIKVVLLLVESWLGHSNPHETRLFETPQHARPRTLG